MEKQRSRSASRSGPCRVIELEERARSIVERIAALPPHALRAAKQCMAGYEGVNLLGFKLERELGGALLDSAETQRLINDFLEKNTKR